MHTQFFTLCIERGKRLCSGLCKYQQKPMPQELSCPLPVPRTSLFRHSLFQTRFSPFLKVNESSDSGYCSNSLSNRNHPATIIFRIVVSRLPSPIHPINMTAIVQKAAGVSDPSPCMELTDRPLFRLRSTPSGNVWSSIHPSTHITMR